MPGDDERESVLSGRLEEPPTEGRPSVGLRAGDRIVLPMRRGEVAEVGREVLLVRFDTQSSDGDLLPVAISEPWMLERELPPEPASLRESIAAAINRFSAEGGSNTPDHVLAGFLIGCLEVFDRAVVERARWYGRMDTPASGGGGHSIVRPVERAEVDRDQVLLLERMCCPLLRREEA